MIKKYEEPGSNSHPPHLEEKNICQNQDQRFSSKKKNEPTPPVQINVEFL
jgi:hypothetical protein